jgi:hypothetical protein
MAISAAKMVAHRQACERQSDSRLLTLPREIRDRIWEDVVTGNVIHVSTCSDIHVKRRRSGRPKRPRWNYHSCMASKGLESSACPPGSGDHIHCLTSGPSNYAIIHLVCKQIHIELDSADTFFSHNALQFADLHVAYKYLFGLKEDDRAAITHLRLSIPYSWTSVEHDAHRRPKNVPEWQAICNYFSNPWDRRTVRHKSKPSNFHRLLLKRLLTDPRLSSTCIPSQGTNHVF